MSTMKRIEKLRELLKKEGLEAIFVTDGANVFYFSGFAGTPGDASLLVTLDSAYVLTDFRYTIQVGQQCPDYTLIGSSSADYKTLAEYLKKENVSKAAFENTTIAYRIWQAITDAAPGVQWKGIGEKARLIRNYKDDDEIAKITTACEIASDALAYILPIVKAGAKEQDVCTELEYQMKKRGASGPSFDTIVASGARSALPHGLASDKIIENHDPVTFDFGSLFKGYCSDMTRTFFVGEPTAEMRKIYEIVLEAQLAAIDAFRPGMLGKDLDKVSRDIITSYGYGECFGHSLGHGVGVEIHEGVAVSKRGEMALTEGMVFSIEPGIYVENVGGVRIEDLVTVKNGELVIMTHKSQKELICL